MTFIVQMIGILLITLGLIFVPIITAVSILHDWFYTVKVLLLSLLFLEFISLYCLILTTV